jgi:hypothetical protein
MKFEYITKSKNEWYKYYFYFYYYFLGFVELNMKINVDLETFKEEVT